MATHQKSWHSVNKELLIDRGVSILLFRLVKPTIVFILLRLEDAGQYLVNQVLKIDSSLRMGIRKLFKKGIIENPHVYKKEDPKT